MSHSSQNDGDIFGHTPNTSFKPSLEHFCQRVTSSSPSSVGVVNNLVIAAPPVVGCSWLEHSKGFEFSLMNVVMLDLNRAEKIGSQKFPCPA